MMRAWWAITLLVAVGSCGDAIPASDRAFVAKARTALENELLDYPSARFQNVRLGKDGGLLCGEVNTKNRMGAYTGWMPFIMAEDAQGEVIFLPPTRPCGQPASDWRAVDASASIAHRS